MLFSLSALAGNLSFRLSLTGSQLTLFSQGDSSAFYPAVFSLLQDGRWEQLKPIDAAAELPAGGHARYTWPDTRPLQQLSEFERLQPVMVRFFDQAGVGFGQISFFHAPPPARNAVKARYVSGALQIEPPEGTPLIRASWVLWPQEDGIAPIRLPVRFEHRAPPARRIDWQQQGRVPFRINTGAGQPAVILIHETEQGYALQFVAGGGLQGREQRAAWLDATPKFYIAAWIAAGIGAIALALQFLWRPRARPTKGRAKK